MTLLELVRRIQATRIVTPAQERQINELLWQRSLSVTEYQALQELVTGIIAGEIQVISQIQRFGSKKELGNNRLQLA
ncbi:MULTISPECIES: hypothetical protein [unclassified Thermosynechococcus]|uniref:hypothetical protein n=1 Tax=unclassified Thermosynechococcus TaxID=2622553 RepID=UPI0019E0DE98|nr:MULTISPECIES: hypothetical protein [unclassified Thermosynechococcus]HIK34936.1 hypothetical protein [Thermosynechococcus sp. M98_K2018_005]HIK48436.1 hypothetical protein [Thermosynechococcus sp. M55_K2018_012]